MKTKFNITIWLAENREQVIAKHTQLSNEMHFNGMTLKEFMVEVLNIMVINNVKSENRAKQMLPMLMGNIYMNNCRIEGNDKVTERLAAQHQGTAFMAMV